MLDQDIKYMTAKIKIAFRKNNIEEIELIKKTFVCKKIKIVKMNSSLDDTT